MVNFNRNYDGLYVEQSITSSQCLRGYYKKGINCIWWHKKYRHWWIGDCNNRPENVGHAWLEPDVTCPNQAGSDWRKSGTDEELNGYVTIGIYCIHTSAEQFGRYPKNELAKPHINYERRTMM